MTSTGKKIGVSIALLLPAIAVAAVLLFILLSIDEGSGAPVEVGATFGGVWALLCGYYFKSPRFKQGGLVLMAVAVVGLYVNLGSLPDEGYDAQVSSAFIALESQRSMSAAPSRSDALTRTADKINSNVPMMIDSNTRLDSAVALTDKLQYNYTLMSVPSAGDGASLLQQIETEKVSNACGLEDNISLLITGVTLELVYHASDGSRITTISVSNEDCQF